MNKVSKVTEDKKWILFITLPLAIIIIVACITVVQVSKHPLVVRMEMDNNSLEAVKIMDARQIVTDINNEHTESVWLSNSDWTNVVCNGELFINGERLFGATEWNRGWNISTVEELYNNGISTVVDVDCQQCQLDLFAEHTAKLKYIEYIENQCNNNIVVN